MERKVAPFRVYKRRGLWFLKGGPTVLACFSTPGEAIDYAYKNWPWWP